MRLRSRYVLANPMSHRGALLLLAARAIPQSYVFYMDGDRPMPRQVFRNLVVMDATQSCVLITFVYRYSCLLSF